MFDGQLLYGTLMIVATVLFHVAGLVTLESLLRRQIKVRSRFRAPIVRVYVVGFSVLVIIGIHTVEAWGWAAVYCGLGEFDSLKQALYFSVVTATTLGYGDITLSEHWQLLGTFESMGGLILFGTSTAFLIEVMRNLFDESFENKGSERS